MKSAAQFAAQPAERRQFGRRKTQAHGWLKVAGRASHPCIVRDISEGGALVEISDAPWLPNRFHLVVESEGIAKDCEIRHVNGATFGVEFVARRQPIVIGNRG